jgi:hypothetical protein
VRQTHAPPAAVSSILDRCACRDFSDDGANPAPIISENFP